MRPFGPSRPSRPAVFLDRDGVLNAPEFRDGRSYAPRRLSDFHLYPDAAPSVARLKSAGFATVVATNQPDVAVGLTPLWAVEAMHARLRVATGVDLIEVSYDRSGAPARRRKPAPGMLFDAAATLAIDLAASWMVGDRAGDVVAGRSAGCRTVFVDRGYTAEPAPDAPDAVVSSLGEAVDFILDAVASPMEWSDALSA